MIKHFGSIVLFVFFALSTGFCTEIKTIAVIDFGSQNTSASDASIISNFLRRELVKKECFQVVDKTNMQKILEEQKFQYSGVTDQQYAVKIGKILNVQLMVIGVYSKLEEMSYITANIVDVETGEIIISEKMRFENIKDVDRTVEKLADQLAKDVYKEKLYDITKLKKWHFMGVRGGSLKGDGNTGGGGEVFYNYITDFGLGLQLNLGLFSSKRKWGTVVYFAPIVFNYYFFPDKIVSPFLGIGVHYWEYVLTYPYRHWTEDPRIKGINFLLNAGTNVLVTKNMYLNLDIKYFIASADTGILSHEPVNNLEAASFCIGFMAKLN
ncbi:MAG: CsgG/HfaB family protein [Elusimicrobiota bacterium]